MKVTWSDNIGTFTAIKEQPFFYDGIEIGDNLHITLAVVQDYSTIENLKSKKPKGWVWLHSKGDYDWAVIYEINELKKLGTVKFN